MHEVSRHRSKLRGLTAALTLGLVATSLAAGSESASAVSRSAAQLATPTTLGVTYHVDCSSTADGTGTIDSPWNSLAEVDRHGEFAPGDAILFKRGSSCSGTLSPRGSGTAAAPIVVGAYGSGSLPTLNGGGTRSGTGTVELRNQAYWTLQDLHVTNRGVAAETSSYRSAVLIRNVDGGRLPGIVVQRLKIDAVVSNLTFKWPNDPREFGGITVVTTTLDRPDSGFDGLQILHNTVSGVGRTGIIVSNHSFPKATDSGVRIGYNKVVRARGDSIILRGSSYGRIDHNEIAYGASFWPCKQCGQISPNTANAAIWPAGSDHTLIDHNEVYGEHKLGGDGEGIDVDMSAQHTIVQYNYLHDNQGGGVLFCSSSDTTVRFNILQNNQQAAFTFYYNMPAKRTSIYNNTVFSKQGNTGKIVRVFGDKQRHNPITGLSFFNNVIFNSDVSGWYLWPTTPSARNNTYVGIHGLNEPTDRNKGYVNPGLLNPGSGKVGFSSLGGYKSKHNQWYMSGSAIPKSVTTDFFGKKINPAKPPRGAAG